MTRAIGIMIHFSDCRSGSVALPSPLLDLLPTDLKKKGIFARTLNGVGYVANALKLSIMPFEAGKADYRKNKFETAFVRLVFTASGRSTYIILLT